MLRHQPEQFDLELNATGFADIGEVVRALNERLGEPVREDDLRKAVESGDRIRYEIQDDKIRALYGHSIPVEPGDASKPPEMLFVAIAERDLERAKRFGLRGGRRRFLHLALSEDDARETGRRLAEQYTILEVRALDAWEEGINFYDRRSLWLAEEVPTQLLDVGETYTDGSEPSHGRGREGGGRERERGGRGRGRGRGRDSERGGRGGRSRRPERGEGEDRPERSNRPERSERPARPEGGQRDERPRRSERPARTERPERSEREENRRPERERPAAREPREAAPKPAAAKGSFGLGLDSEHVKPASKPAPKPEPRQAPKVQAPAPEPKEPSGGGFGAGL